jgi:phenylalanyl-tRNA synthetase beta chain
MKTCPSWLNDYLDPPLSPAEQAEVLTAVGFPLDGQGRADGADEDWQEIEITSNRGDCLAHLGFAREIAAATGRRLKEPAGRASAEATPATGLVTVRNERTDLCPLYTARVIRGVTVKPSPEWLAKRLRAIGLVPRNNLVDATNFVLFELGQPTHVFDLATLAGKEIVVRNAREGEPFLPIGEGAAEVKLRSGDLVIADRDRAVAIAGVKGGALTAVRESTRDILIEAASFDPVAVRATSRALRIASDSSYRFERGVHPAEVDAAAERLVSLILEVAGGELAAGSVRAGRDVAPPRRVSLRPDRCRAILGIPLADAEMERRLATLGFAPARQADGSFACTVPPRRLDVEREIDLIEEVCRLGGLDAIPAGDSIRVRVPPFQPRVAGLRAVKDLLAGLGLVECVTHSLVAEKVARPFVPAGGSLLEVDDERAGGEPALRPSLVPSLLRVRQRNLDEGCVRLDLFEYASSFVGRGHEHHENRMLAILVDPPEGSVDRDATFRRLRGVIDRLAGLLAGHDAEVAVRAVMREEAGSCAWLEPEATVTVAGAPFGRFGLVAKDLLRAYGLEHPVAAAELDLEALLSRYPPEIRTSGAPAFPSADRDISAIVDERVTWAELAATIRGLSIPELERIELVSNYRGKQTGAGRKSVSMRLVFRAPDRTLTGDEIEAATARAIAALVAERQAEVRSA